MVLRRNRLIIFIILSVLSGVVFYREAILQIFSAVIHRDGSSHGIFVPFLSLYFLWLQFDKLKKIELQTYFKGLGLMIAGLVFPILNIGTYHVQFIGFLLLLAGLVMLILGRDMFNHTAFPLFFLIAMIPIPGSVYLPMADALRHISFGGSLKIMDLLHVPYFRDGWNLELHNINLVVNTGCSGIRYLISYFVFGIAYAYLTRDSLKQRLIVVFSTIPLSLCASVMRLTFVFGLAHYVSPVLAHHKPHVVISWINFVIFLFGAIAFDQWLQKRRESNKTQLNTRQD